MSPDTDLLDSTQRHIFIIEENVLFIGLFHSIWNWLRGPKVVMYEYVYIYVFMYEHVYLGAQSIV